MKEAISIREASALLGYKYTDPVERLINAGELKVFRIHEKGHRKISKAQVMDLINRRTA